jgi:heptosyltransferase-2
MEGHAHHDRHAPELGSCRNILVVKLDRIGDWVLCTPFFDHLRRCAPQARITAIVAEQVYPLAAACAHLDRVVALQHRDDSHRFTAADSLTVSAFLADYCTGRFDLALVPRWDVDFADAGQIAAASGAPHVVGFAEACTDRKRRLARGADRFYTHLIESRELAHEAEQSPILLEALGAPRVAIGPVRIDTLPLDDQAAASFARRVFGHDARRLLAIAPFAAEARRTLPATRLVPLCRWLIRSCDLKLVVLGAPEDKRAAEDLVSRVGNGAASACGDLTLRQSAALIRRCAALIGMDSGPAHIAAAVDTPVIVLSCHPRGGDPTHENSPRRFAPWAEPSRVLVLQPPQAKAPCTGGCGADEAHCILGLSEAQLAYRVYAFVQSHLARATATRTL